MEIHPDTRNKETLVDRLRGIYNVPINDGLGPINGSMAFTRNFVTPPIQQVAADRIEELEKQLQDAHVMLERIFVWKDDVQNCAPELGALLNTLAEAHCLVNQDTKSSCNKSE